MSGNVDDGLSAGFEQVCGLGTTVWGPPGRLPGGWGRAGTGLTFNLRLLHPLLDVW